MMRFRPLTATDIAEGPRWLGAIALRPDRWRDDDTRSAVSVDSDGRMLAAGILWRSRAHDGHYWADVVVAPGRRRQGIGTAMVGHLASLRNTPRPFVTRGYADEPRLAFAYALGGRARQTVPPADVDTANRTVLRPMPGVATGADVSLDALRAANASFYRWIHEGWSPVGPEFAAVVNDGLEDDLDCDATAVALDTHGRIRALALVYRDDDAPVVCAETVERDEPDGERLVESCLRAALDVLAGRGIQRVTFDGHVTDPHLMPNWAKLAPSGRWFLLVEVPAG